MPHALPHSMFSLKKLFNLYLKSSIHVGVAVGCFTALTYLHFAIPINHKLVTFCFFSTVFAYNAIKYSDLIYNGKNSLTANLKIILTISVLSLLGMSYFLQIFGWIEIFLLIILGTISYLYSHSVLNRFNNLRNITGIKIVIIAAVWTGTTVVLPGLSENLYSDSRLWIESFQRFLLVIILTLPFDLRDLRTDIGEIKTIPQLIGIKKTKALSGALCFLIIISELMFSYKTLSATIFLISITILLFIITAKLSVFQSKYVASFWVEGIPIIWFIILYILI